MSTPEDHRDFLEESVKNRNFLKESVKHYRIIIDTNSINSSQANKFWENIVPILQGENKKIYVPFAVCAELKKFVKCAINKEFTTKKR